MQLIFNFFFLLIYNINIYGNAFKDKYIDLDQEEIKIAQTRLGTKKLILSLHQENENRNCGNIKTKNHLVHLDPQDLQQDLHNRRLSFMVSGGSTSACSIEK